MNYHEIVKGLRDGSISTGLNNTKRKLWPRYCYHFTNIDNAIRILKLGCLLSRKDAVKQGLMINDNANHEIIKNTKSAIEQYVRLYFRPQTPTLWDNEGFRAPKYYQNAKCPFPIYFLFSLEKVLSLANVRFSHTSLALHPTPQLYAGEVAFRQLHFELIYHDSAIEKSDRNKIVHHRQAEIIVPNSLSMDYLQHLVVRTSAERDTLIQMLTSAGISDKYASKIVIDESNSFFFKNWSYIDEVLLSFDKINITAKVDDCAFPNDWSSSKIALVPENYNDYIDFRLELKDKDGHTWHWPRGGNSLLRPHFTLTLNRNVSPYKLTIFLNDQIAYQGTYTDDFDLPF